MAVVTAAFCLLEPVAAVAAPAVKALTSAGLLLASMIYLTIFGVLSACYFKWAASTLLFRLSMLGAGISIAGASIAAELVPDPAKALQFGMIAAVLATATIAVANIAGTMFGRYVWFPLRRQPVAALPPSRATAVWLWYLTQRLDDAASAWRLTSTRRELLTWIAHTAFWLDVRMPRAMWLAGYRGPVYAEARSRYRRASSFVRDQAWRVMDANDRASFERIRDDLAEESVSMARGDWTSLPAVQERTRSSWMLAVARRLVTPMLLGGAALLLPHLPDVKLTGTALTSLQAALLVAAVLSLTPIDASSREQILGAFTDPHHRG